jgi:hypothetical protein
VRALSAYFRGDFAALFAAIGSKSAVAEAEEEITAIAQALDGKRGG